MSPTNHFYPIVRRRLNATAANPNSTPVLIRGQEGGFESAILALGIAAGILLLTILLVALDWATEGKLPRPARRLGGATRERAGRAWLRIRHPAASKALEAGGRAEAGRGPPPPETARTPAGPGASGARNKLVGIPPGGQPGHILSRQEMRRDQVKKSLKKGRKNNLEKGPSNGSS